jgi:hypothetical protein
MKLPGFLCVPALAATVLAVARVPCSPRYLGVIFFVGISGAAPMSHAQGVVINEFLAINEAGLTDSDGVTSDWIEIYNSGATTVSLLGWSLTDDASQLRKWQFPATNLAANAYLLVFASGKNRTNAGAELHTNFQLDGDGEYLALVMPDGVTVASQFNPKFPKQRKDISFGLGTDAGLHYLKPPTPRTVNATNYVQFVADTKFSVDRGFFSAPISVVVTTATAGATIYFTTNGSVPSSTNGFIYSNPIGISRTTTLRAAAHKSGFEPSNVDTHTYLFLQDIVTQDYQSVVARGFPTNWGSTAADYGLDPDVVGRNGTDLFGGKYTATLSNDLRSLPSVSLTFPVHELFGTDGIYTQSTQEGDAWERPVSFELLYPDGRQNLQVNAGVRIQGGFFRFHFATRKHSFRIAFREQYGPGKWNEPLFGFKSADQFNTLVLRAGANDAYSWQASGRQPLYIRDSFIRDTIGEMGRSSAKDFFVHLYLNGVYWGLYDLSERPDAAFAESYFGGSEENWDALNDNGVSNGSGVAWANFLNLCAQGLASAASYQRVQGNNPDGTPNPGLTNYLDVDAMNDYLIALFWGGTRDWPAKNYWLLRHQTNNTGFQFMAWDMEQSMGLLETNATFNPTTFTNDVAAPYGAARANAEYRLRFADRVHRHLFNGGALYVDPAAPQWDPPHPERNRPAARFAALAAEIEPAMVAESARWGDQHNAAPYTRDEQWRVERDFILTNWISKRASNVLQQFRAAGLYPNIVAPGFNQHGGAIAPGFQLAITAPAGQIYFTTNGLDPRLTNSATIYNTPVSLLTNTVVKARALSGGEWSALNEAEFVVNRPRLLISEIHYHPADPNTEEQNAGFNNSDDFEFLELVNVGTNALHLAGLRLTNAVRFNFSTASNSILQPGEIVLLVKNQTAFQIRYGSGLPVIGQYQGNLANDGENLLLLDSIGPLLDLTYQTGAPWPDADGTGPSLDAVSLTGDFNSPANWRASTQTGGTPGRIPGAELRISSIRLVSGKIILQFQANAGGSYTLSYKPSLQTADWTALNTVPAGATNELKELEDEVPPQTTQRYYRVSSP